MILGKEQVDENADLLASQLSTEMQMLHHIIARIFFPKIGKFDFVSKLDILVM